MCAGVPLANSSQAIFRKLIAGLGVVAKMPQLLGHFDSIAHYNIILSRTEKVFLVRPRRTDQWNAASQGFKHPDRWNSRETIGILAARDMHGERAYHIDLRKKKIGKIAAVFHVGAYQLLQRKVRIANAMGHYAHFRQCPRRLNQEFLQFGGAFIVTPVADPDHINFLAALEWTKLLNVSGFMKSPRPVDSEAVDVNAADGLTERQYAIHQVQMKFQDFAGPSVSTMMAVMEQSNEAELFLQSEHLIDHLRIIPFVQQHQMSFFQFLVKKLGELVAAGPVKADIEFRISAAERINGLNGALAFLLHQVRKRPGIQFLITAHRVPHADQFTHQSAQKMSVAVVPVRDNGMSEKRDIELLTHALSASAGASFW